MTTFGKCPKIGQKSKTTLKPKTLNGVKCQPPKKAKSLKNDLLGKNRRLETL